MLAFVENFSSIIPGSSVHKAVQECYELHSQNESFREIFRNFSWIKDLAEAPENYGYAHGSSEMMKQQLLHKHSLAFECVLINGKFEPSLSQLPEGVFAYPLEEASSSFSTFMRQFNVEEHPLAFINAEGSLQGGVVFYIPEGEIIDEQIFIRHITFPSAGKQKILFLPKIIIVLGCKACARIHVSHHVESDNRTPRETIVNGVTEVFVSKNAEIILSMASEYAKEDQFCWSHIATIEEQGSCMIMENLLKDISGSGLFNNTFYMVGDQAHSESLVTIKSPKKTWVKNLMYHDAIETTSRQNIKSILCSGEFFFEGSISITPQGKLSDAYQKHDTLLLSDSAKVSTFPRLEILTDDVKASHGATVGPLDPNQIFYMRSRGMTLEEAQAKLIKGFFAAQPPVDAFPQLSTLFNF
ncbi:SufD family Fe-S cluster assembly protein [Chlamydia sp. 17-3921]|uniref:SufD family Fe-S cluster assembly protein n=1 Tax=Chlamydia sp. 17-3921 TaxID=2675798 RepID=UPI0019184263|nr:SufD family Fe-S cluster assembly protein [Chlamydia sp. 17-3921]